MAMFIMAAPQKPRANATVILTIGRNMLPLMVRVNVPAVSKLINMNKTIAFIVLCGIVGFILGLCGINVMEQPLKFFAWAVPINLAIFILIELFADE